MSEVLFEQKIRDYYGFVYYAHDLNFCYCSKCGSLSSVAKSVHMFTCETCDEEYVEVTRAWESAPLRVTISVSQELLVLEFLELEAVFNYREKDLKLKEIKTQLRFKSDGSTDVVVDGEEVMAKEGKEKVKDFLHVFCHHKTFDKILTCINASISSFVQQRYSFDLPEVAQSKSVEDWILRNRFPLQYNTLKELGIGYIGDLAFKKLDFVKTEDPNWVKTVSQNLGWDCNRTTKKLISKLIFLEYPEIVLIKDVNLIKAYATWRENVFSHGIENTLKIMLKIIGEKNTVKKITTAGDNSYYLNDVETMVESLIDHNYQLSSEDFKGNVKEIHDRLSRELDKIERPNELIAYTVVERSLEKEISGYKFQLAKDTHELIDIGSQMGICVGSYGNRAINKKCNILHIKSGDKYIQCIEVSPELKVVQTKSAFNKKPEGVLKKAIIDWCKLISISYEECSDLNNEAPDYGDFDDF